MKTLSAKAKISGLTLVELLLLILFASFQSASAGLSFLSNTYSVGHAPGWVTAADANGDGRLDLICANYTDNTLTILTNSGGGVFGSNATLNVGNRPASVVAADLRNLGKVDLICANFGGGGGKTLTVLTNNGNGVFGSNVTLTAGIGPTAIAVGDFNADGKLDLVCANTGTNGNEGTTLTVFTNNGSGVLVSNLALSVGSEPLSVATTDVNGDGKLDIVCANGLGNSISVLTNKGGAKFATSATITVGTGPSCVVAGDVNGDGKADLITANTSANTLTVVTNKNNGSGGFVTSVTLSLPPLGAIPALPEGVAIADLNGDGKLDLVSANSDNGFGGTLSVFTNSVSYKYGSNTLVTVGDFPFYVIAADLNSDGKPDLVSANQNVASLTVLKNTNSFPASVSAPNLSLKLQSSIINVSWQSAAPGWSLQENSDLVKTNWLSSGYRGFPIDDDGTNKSHSFPNSGGSGFFRLIHP
ncbi:MAG TPA: VCBS repeat-containing protein [Verrucomicrobiae bacterium]|nr:VCBS repeat-containing protein [Verrucomicrobiae bacterium]